MRAGKPGLSAAVGAVASSSVARVRGVSVTNPEWLDGIADWDRTYATGEERMQLALWSGVRRLVYGATPEDASGAGFDEGPVFPASHAYLRERGIEIVGGVLREEARAVLTMYVERGGEVY